LKIKTLRLSATNDYLIENSGRYILVDTGYEEDWEAFERGLDRAGVRLDEISHIFLTHHHDDHCGLLNPIVRIHPEVRVVMSAKAPELLLKGENDRTHGGGLINARIKRLWVFKQLYLSLKTHRQIKKENNLKFPPYPVRDCDILISADVRAKEIGIDLDGVIVATPGHTVDSISLVLDNGDCFAGDAAANFLQFAGTHYCVIFVADLDEYYRSWEKMLSLHPKTIFPAHGKLFPAEKLRENLRKNRKEDVIVTM
jgi:glyoxylase-like metal-dependent hydrolase (beta-lactamase superfamily II)